MIPDGTYLAVVDRIEDDVATLLLEEDGTDAYQLDIDPEVLSTEARHPDAVLSVELSDGEIVATTYEAETTEQRQEIAQRRFDRLAERPPQAEDEDQ